MPRWPLLRPLSWPPRTPGGGSAGCWPARTVSYPLLLDELFSGTIAR
jgi:hypothetical protein